MVPDDGRRLLGSVPSTPLFAQSTGQAQCAQKCAECQLCPGEMENAVWSRKWNMDLNIFIFIISPDFFLAFPQTGGKSYRWPTDTEPGRFTLSPQALFI